MSAQTWQVATPTNGFEGVAADEYEIHPSGALIFQNREGSLVALVLAYAPGAWVAFWMDSE